MVGPRDQVFYQYTEVVWIDLPHSVNVIGFKY